VIDAALAARVRRSLEALRGHSRQAKSIKTLGGVEAFLRGPFAAWHGRLTRSRPRWWVFGDRHRQVLIAHDRADRSTLAAALRTC